MRGGGRSRRLGLLIVLCGSWFLVRSVCCSRAGGVVVILAMVVVILTRLSRMAFVMCHCRCRLVPVIVVGWRFPLMVDCCCGCWLVVVMCGCGGLVMVALVMGLGGRDCLVDRACCRPEQMVGTGRSLSGQVVWIPCTAAVNGPICRDRCPAEHVRVQEHADVARLGHSWEGE